MGTHPIFESDFDCLTDQWTKKQKWKFWGPAPVAFRFAENGESYFVGSDVANYMRLFRGKLYNTFPNLTIRKATKDEVRKIPDLTREDHHKSLSENGVTLVLAEEIDEVWSNGGERFKNATANIKKIVYSSTFKKEEKKQKKSKAAASQKAAASGAAESQPQTAQHM